MSLKESNLIGRIVFIILFIVAVGGFVYYILFFTPKDSLELYQAISFADNVDEVQKLMLEGYEDNIKIGDFEYMNSINTSADSVRQFSLFEYNDRSYVVETSPGTQKLKILSVEELPEEIRRFFLELHQ